MKRRKIDKLLETNNWFRIIEFFQCRSNSIGEIRMRKVILNAIAANKINYLQIVIRDNYPEYAELLDKLLLLR